MSYFSLPILQGLLCFILVAFLQYKKNSEYLFNSMRPVYKKNQIKNLLRDALRFTERSITVSETLPKQLTIDKNTVKIGHI